MINKPSLLTILFLVLGTAATQAQPRNVAQQNILMPSFLRSDSYSYSGLDFSMSVRNYTFESDIPELKKLAVRQAGANIGGVWGSSFAKIRPRVGLFYSDGSVPHTIDMAEIAVSGNIYFMKKINHRRRSIEPYLVGNISYQCTKFFGTYLDDDATTNYSVSEEKVLGRVDALRATGGFGGEMQLWSANGQFIHLYSEVLTGMSMRTHYSNESFAETFSRRPARLTVGISVGIGK